LRVGNALNPIDGIDLGIAWITMLCHPLLDSADERIPADHPLRVIRQLLDAALAELSRAFAKLYARDGRPSISPERLLHALLRRRSTRCVRNCN
jgi:hypothetical protein